MSLPELARMAWAIETFMRMDQHQAACQQELELCQVRIAAHPFLLPTTHIPMPVNPVSQEDGE